MLEQGLLKISRDFLAYFLLLLLQQLDLFLLKEFHSHCQPDPSGNKYSFQLPSNVLPPWLPPAIPPLPYPLLLHLPPLIDPILHPPPVLLLLPLPLLLGLRSPCSQDLSALAPICVGGDHDDVLPDQVGPRHLLIMPVDQTLPVLGDRHGLRLRLGWGLQQSLSGQLGNLKAEGEGGGR